MHYRKVIFLVNLFFAAGSFLFFDAGILFVRFSVWIMVGFFILGFILFMFFIIPELMNFAKVYAISRYGSREDNDLSSHFADLFFARIFAGKILTQVNIKNEEEMTTFADGLINIYGSEVLPEVLKFYPDVSEQYWISLFKSLVSVEKEVMLHIFFSEKYGELEAIKPAVKLKENYPFMSVSTLEQLIKWWKSFKLKMEWQDRVDGIQR
jgi:hypothetical protein